VAYPHWGDILMPVIKALERVVKQQDRIITGYEKIVEVLNSHDRRLSIVETKLEKLINKKK
jgi:hypothetical protein